MTIAPRRSAFCPRSCSTTSTAGAYAEYTLRRNVEDLSEVALSQRVLKNMSDLSLETKLFNETLLHARRARRLWPVRHVAPAVAKCRRPRRRMPKAFRLPSPPCPSLPD